MACERKGQPVEPEPVACPDDAMVCPDGTAVGRTGPSCTFPPCPADPCAGVELPACPPACADDATSRCGQACDAEGEACGNEIGDGMVCQGGTWSCIVHAPLGPGCNAVCRRAPGP
jgi:hypothetical protein